jgi:Rieske Fe-S protein
LDVSDDDPCVVTTNQGTINAAAVIVASHFPFNDKILYATRLQPHRSYVLAARLAEPVPQGMFIATDSSHTMRNHSGAEGEFLLVGGEGHYPGQGDDTIEHYQRVEKWARAHFNVESIVYRWSTQDNQSLDRLPYIGRYSPTSHHVYVAAGFGGWGMTNSMVAGMLLRDLILERENPWAELYDPNRINLKDLPEFAKHSAQVAKHFVGDRLIVTDTIELGEGKIVNTEAGAVAVYMAEDGSLSAVSPACTHMGCFVQWNSAEKSWDCPCHGSRFALDGTVIHGPALKNLKKVNVRIKEPI